MTLTRELAGARFLVVFLIELAALGACYLPLRGKEKKPWQKDCFALGSTATGVAFAMAALAGATALGLPPCVSSLWVVRLLEGAIFAIYVWNIYTLVRVTVRTGGSAASLYATLIPIQLSAMLFLQFQRDRLTGTTSAALTSVYVAIAIAGYIVAYVWSKPVYKWCKFSDDEPTVDWTNECGKYAVGLAVCGMLLSFLIYLVPPDFDWLKRLYTPRQEQQAEVK